MKKNYTHNFYSNKEILKYITDLNRNSYLFWMFEGTDLLSEANRVSFQVN